MHTLYKTMIILTMLFIFIYPTVLRHPPPLQLPHEPDTVLNSFHWVHTHLIAHISPQSGEAGNHTTFILWRQKTSSER